ncbi:DoxX family membrane protein [Schaalia vaccimaxillae]|uniref:DoxX family membrane protein n=1 Tax=Schaalia vaccimaxillae TaxID=183916 RepID=UPI0003B51EA1|nr:DoxX family membrane protein [Schaalia vaccimaxillae]
MNILRAIARPLLATPFIADGVSAMKHPDDHVRQAQSIKPLLNKIAPHRQITDEDLRRTTRALGAVTTCAGVCFALGKAPRAAAATLTAVAVPMALVNNPVWQQGDPVQKSEHRTGLIARLGLVGGLAIASVDREGRPSAKWHLANWRTHRAALADVRSTERARAQAKIDRKLGE